MQITSYTKTITHRSFIHGDECLCHQDRILQAPCGTLLPLLVPAGGGSAKYHYTWAGEGARKGRAGESRLLSETQGMQR